MNCVICTNPFAEGDKKTESPCGCIGHTSCAFRLLSDYVLGYSRYPLDCPSCRTQIYRHNWLDQSDEDNRAAENHITKLKENSEFNKDLIFIKKKLRLCKKEIGKFKKYLTPKKAQLKNETKSHLDIIKSYYKRYMDAAKKEQVYKLSKRYNASYKYFLTRFKEKYDLTDDAVKLLKCGTRYSYYWHNSPCGIARRAFRVRLNL
jgi:hypothetical protein